MVRGAASAAVAAYVMRRNDNDIEAKSLSENMLSRHDMGFDWGTRKNKEILE